MKATVLLLFLALALVAPRSTVQAAPPAKSAPAKPAPAKAAKPPADPGWPREFTKEGVKLTVYQPQIDEWKDYRDLKVRAAIVLTIKDGKPTAGVAEFGGKTTTDIETRTVLIRDLKITAARFPSLPDAEVEPTEALLKKTFPGRSMNVSLDRLAAGAERSKDAKPLDLKMDPPEIHVSTAPGVLLMLVGKPVLAPVEGTNLQFVVNTNWDLFVDKDTYYLLAGKAWLTTKKPEGQWTLVSKLPDAFSKLPKGDQWAEVKKAVPPKIERGMVVPQVVYAEKPAELIVFNGNPVWEAVEGTNLLWAKNTESWVFQDKQDQQLYFLVSGRWFRAPKFEGPWTYAGNDLPPDFAQIPPDSPCDDVLSSVPGTPEATDAVLLAEVPSEAVIKRKEAEAKAKVAYDGNPQFEPIEGTTMAYAKNTSSDVVQVDQKYYLCQDAVWFVADAANGPWTICVDVPAAIYTIPPACPVHRVAYVKVEAGDSDDEVVCSYTAGYYGAFVAGAGLTAALVWGTGWYYSPYVLWGGDVPIFHPWPATYGVAAAYNPWSGGYAVGGAVYGPYAAAGRAAWYNPATGNYGRAAHVSGPYGGRTVAAGYNPRTDTAWATRQGNNGYAQWGTSAVRRGDDWVRAGHVVTDDGGAARWRGSEGGGRVWKGDDHSGGVAYHDGNMYAGRDGNVYRRDDDGNWAKYDDGDWDSIDKKDELSDKRNRYQDQKSGKSTKPNDSGGNADKFKPGENNRPGQNGGGEQKFKPGENTRPGQGGGGEQKLKPGQLDRPGQGGGGEQRPRPGQLDRPGQGGGGVQRERGSFENRAPARRAEAQPPDDVMQNLNRESFNRQRSDFSQSQRQSIQRSGGGGQAGSRSFGGGGGGGGHARGGGGGGGRRR